MSDEDEYTIDCPYREQSDSGRDYCNRFSMDTDEQICGGCRVADQILKADDDLEIGDLL